MLYQYLLNQSQRFAITLNISLFQDSNQDLSTAYDQGLSVIQDNILELSHQTEILFQTWMDKELPVPKKSAPKYQTHLPKPAIRDQPGPGRANRITQMLTDAGQKCGQVADGILELRKQILARDHKISKLQYDLKTLKLNISSSTGGKVHRAGTPSKLLKSVLKKESTGKSVTQINGYPNADDTQSATTSMVKSAVGSSSSPCSAFSAISKASKAAGNPA